MYLFKLFVWIREEFIHIHIIFLAEEPKESQYHLSIRDIPFKGSNKGCFKGDIKR